MMTFFQKLVSLFAPRKPDFIIGGADTPYMLRWWLIPRNRWFNVYLHKIIHDDEDRALHDHPWPSLSVTLAGECREIRNGTTRNIKAGCVTLRSSEFAHRLELPQGKPCWTLFVTGPRLREWGFWCPKGWIPWQEFCDPTDYGKQGKGCGES